MVDPPAATSTVPKTSAWSLPVWIDRSSVADSSVTMVSAEIDSATDTLMSDPLVMLKLPLATLSPSATVAANVLSTSSSEFAAVSCRVSASDRDMFASTPTLAAKVEMLKKLPETISMSVAASDAISDAYAERVPPEPISTEFPTLTSTFLPTVWIRPSAVSTNIVAVSRAISWTAEMSRVLFSMTSMSVEETSIADMTSRLAMSELMSMAPPEWTPRPFAATVSIIDAVRLTCCPTVIAECRPVRTTESVVSSISSSPADAWTLPTDESSMFGDEMFTRSVE